MDDSGRLSGLPHKLTMTDRRSVSVTGITEVISFDEKQVMLRTEQYGKLSVTGEDLHVTRLSLEKGEAELCGNIQDLRYYGKAAGAQGSTGASRWFR